MSPQAANSLWDTAISSPLTYTGLEVTCPASYDASKDRLTGKIVIKTRQPAAETDQHEQYIRVASFSNDHKPLDNWSWRINWKNPWTNRPVSATFDKVLSPKARTVRFLVSDAAAQQLGTCEYRLR